MIKQIIADRETQTGFTENGQHVYLNRTGAYAQWRDVDTHKPLLLAKDFSLIWINIED